MDGSPVERSIERIMRMSGMAPDGDLTDSFAACIAEEFGIEAVNIRDERMLGHSKLLEYVANTRQPYVDNQLSEYSSFPELIAYLNAGNRSCAVVPVAIGGRMVLVVEMLSKKQDLFSAGLVGGVTVASYVVGLLILQRRETEQNAKMTRYFNSAFSSPVPQMIVSNEGTILKLNGEAARAFGVTEQQRARLGSLLDIDMKRVKERSMSGRETLVGSRNGTGTYAVHASDAGGSTTYVSARSTRAAERMESIAGLMGKGYGAGFIEFGRDLRITYSTQSLGKIIGYDSGLALSRSIVDLVAERERGAFKEAVERVDKEGSSTGMVGFSTDRGTISQVNFIVSRAPEGYLMLFYDAWAQAYVGSMRSAFDEFLDSSSDMALKVDEIGGITYCNHSVEAVLGYERSELLGKDIRTIYADQSVLERDLAYVRNGGKVDNSYTMFTSKDQGQGARKVEATNSIRLFKTGDSPEYVIIAKELETGRLLKAQAEKIKKLDNDKEKLTAMGQQKSRFIYNISHELKTPLTNIKGFSKLLYSGEFGPLNPEQLSHISTIIDEANRLVEMINQILDASKLDSKRMKLELGEVDLRSMESSPSIRALAEMAAKKGLSFSWHSDFDVPTIIADHGRLIQVFVNLIGNSIKFTEEGGIGVHISKHGKRRVRCSVIDTGIGISEENRHRLFRKFYEARGQVHVKQEGSGTGLGLSITKEIVNMHGGAIGYEPVEGHGSEFWFTLPIKRKRKDRSTR